MRRGQVAERIRTAKEFGDISKERRVQRQGRAGFVEERISELEKLLPRRIIQNEVRTDEVGLMTRVTIEEAASGEKMTVDLVGSKESDPKTGRISNESPIGAALLGKRVGQTVDVKAPGGVSTWKVLEIKSAMA